MMEGDSKGHLNHAGNRPEFANNHGGLCGDVGPDSRHPQDGPSIRCGTAKSWLWKRFPTVKQPGMMEGDSKGHLNHAGNRPESNNNHGGLRGAIGTDKP